LFFTSCDDNDSEITTTKSEEETNTLTSYETPKYVFLFIGDGMSTPQINVAEAALGSSDFTLKSASLKSVSLGSLNIQEFPVTGMQTTYSSDSYITDSAAAATALAAGKKTNSGVISMSPDFTEEYTTMAEMAKAKGMKVGIVSSVSIDHATPAAFYAHNESRNNYQAIGQDLLASDFDYFAGGNVRFNKYKDYSLDDFITDAETAGYSYVSTKSDFDALTSESGKVFATLNILRSYTGDGCAMPYAIDLNDEMYNTEDNQITLADFTQKGIELLNNETGFFMMVEGGKIDWACHANDVVSTAMDMIAFDDAIGAALDFYNEHPDETLIIVTGDHECGGLTLGYAATGYATSFELLDYQSESFQTFSGTVGEWKSAGTTTFDEAMVTVQEIFGLGDADKDLALTEYETSLLQNAFTKSMTGESDASADEQKVIYGGYDPFTVTITHVLNNKAGIDWTSYAHTGTPVPVFALGQGMYEFSGYYDNTDIGNKIIEIAELND
jgi:alkaline phosphatase